MEAYLDNAATTKVFDSAFDAMKQVLEKDYGNPSSMHQKGVDAERYVENARSIIAKSMKVEPKEIVFTSGGTESNNMALIGGAFANSRRGKHIITTKIEHASVHSPLIFLEDYGYRLTFLSVDQYGKIDLDELEEALCEDTILVSIMYVNNEIGSVQEIKKIAEMIKQYNESILFHVDAIQAFGKYRIFPKKWGIDLLSVSGHKIHGPKGSGFLFVKDKVKIKPIIYGGGQEKGMRSGTENVPAITGLGQAVSDYYDGHGEKIERIYALKERLIQGAKSIEGVEIIGNGLPLREVAPHIVSVGFQGIQSEVLLHALEEKEIYVSSGSACSSNHPQLSGTLQAVGVKKELLNSVLRFSFSLFTKTEEIDYTIEALRELLPVLRRYRRK